jgi:hypothetical protein
MTSDLGLRVWFLLAMLVLGLAYALAGRVSAHPPLWTNTGVALIGLVGLAGTVGVDAVLGVATGGVLVLVALLESAGLMLGMRRRTIEAGRWMLVAGGTASVLLGGVRILAGAVQAAISTEAVGLGAQLADSVMNPLLVLLGAVALGLGGRVSGFPRGAIGLLSGVTFLLAMLILVVAVGETLAVGRLGHRAFVLGCGAAALAAPTLISSFRGGR